VTGRKHIGSLLIVVAVFAAGFWFGKRSVPEPVAVPEHPVAFQTPVRRPFGLFTQRSQPPSNRVTVVTNIVEKETDLTARVVLVDNGVTNRFRTLKAYYEFMRKKSPELYEHMLESRRVHEERTFDADEKRIEELRAMNLAELPAEQRADIQTILDFNETINAAVDALNSGGAVDVEALNKQYNDLYQVFEREKSRQVEAYGRALGAPNFREMLEGINTLTPHQFFQRYWIVNEKLRENQEEKK